MRSPTAAKAASAAARPPTAAHAGAGAEKPPLSVRLGATACAEAISVPNVHGIGHFPCQSRLPAAARHSLLP